MIVIAIIGVLAASLFPMMSGYMARSRDTARTTDIRSLHTAITSYYDDTGSYPTTPSTLSSTGVITSTGSEWKTGLQTHLTQMLGGKMLTDPISTRSYSYGYVSSTPSPSYQLGVDYELASGPYCPLGFVPVPGNSAFSTSDFCVSKYEMSYSDANTANSTGGGTDWNTVSYVPEKTPISMPGKYPIADINQVQALAACASIGAHLITNNEWMTIARNIEANPRNWMGSFIPNGVSNNLTLGCNSKGGNTESRTYATKTGPGSDETCNAKRVLSLSNNETIYDLAGNVWEHVNRSNNINASTVADIQGAGDLCSTSNYWHTSAYCTTQRTTHGPLTTPTGINQGMGYVSNDSGSDKIFLRGGNAMTTTLGIFSLYLYWTDVSGNRGAGFRCAK